MDDHDTAPRRWAMLADDAPQCGGFPHFGSLPQRSFPHRGGAWPHSGNVPGGGASR